MLDVSGDLHRMRAYAVGRLPDNEREVFEDRLVREPELVREFERFLRLREGLEVLRSEGNLRSETLARPHLQPWRRVLAAAAAAGLALFFWLYQGAGTSSVLIASPGTPSRGDRSALVGARLTFAAVRGESSPSLELPSTGLVELRALPATKSARYRMTLARRQDAGVPTLDGALSGVVLGGDGYLHSYVDASHLASGAYVLRVASDPEIAGTAEEFPFVLRSPAESAR